MSGKAVWGIAALVLVLGAMTPASAQPNRDDEVVAQQRRPRIVIQPRSFQPGPNAKR